MPHAPLITFYGDDFTGSTDAMESLSLMGVPTVLFSSLPTPEAIARHPDARAFGIAGTTRAMNPADMETTLRRALDALRQTGSPIVHYKVCSTFDSSPRVGNIGRVIELGGELFGRDVVPIVVGAPSLGRHCVFGNLFARYGSAGDTFRLDRHPSISRHPITPMDEADLVRHLAKQTDRLVRLLDIIKVKGPRDAAAKLFDSLAKGDSDAILIDLLDESDLAPVGALIARLANSAHPLFVVGSSGVESALVAYWRETKRIGDPSRFPPVRPAKPTVVISGSCSPVTAGQIDWAIANGFDEIALDTPTIVNRPDAVGAIDAAVIAVSRSVKAGRDVVVHAAKGPNDPRVTGSRSAGVDPAEIIGRTLGAIARRSLESTPFSRLIVAGGDTSGIIARALGIESLEMIGELTRGAPLCRARADSGSPTDTLEICFKGGQVGPVDFFGAAAAGIPSKS